MSTPKAISIYNSELPVVMLIALLLAITVASAALGSAVAIEAGTGSGIEKTRMARIGVFFPDFKILSRPHTVEIDLLPLASAGLWKGDREILDLGLTPVFRGTIGGRDRKFRPYIEGAVGFHYISDIQMRQRVFSTNFQFGDHLGIGVLLGSTHAIEIAYIFQHLSNASIKRPNAGINFHIFRITVGM